MSRLRRQQTFLPGVGGGGGGGAPNPLALPELAVTQVAQTSTYQTFNMPTAPIGSGYFDPTTGVRVTKISSPSWVATFGPAVGQPNRAAYHDYNSSQNISMPHGSPELYTVLVGGEGLPARLVDYQLGGTVSNDRLFNPENINPTIGNIQAAFSLKTGDERILWLSSGSTLRRYNVDTNTVVETITGLPAAQSTAWLHTAAQDRLLCYHTATQIICYNPSTTETVENIAPRAWRAITFPADHNEPSMERNGEFVWSLRYSGPNNSVGPYCYRISDGSLVGIQDTFGVHQGILRRYFGYTLGDDDGSVFLADPQNPPVEIRRPGMGRIGYNVHHSGGWVQSNEEDQWFITSDYETSGTITLGGKMQNAIAFIRTSGTTPAGARLLCHVYSGNYLAGSGPPWTGGGYYEQPHACLGPDGKLVLFTSKMAVAQGRGDAFIVEVPLA